MINLIFPFFYTYKVRLGSIKQFIYWLIHNLFVTQILTYLILEKFFGTDVLIFFFLIQLIYELGYIDNDFYANDKFKSNRIKKFSLNNHNGYLLILSKSLVIILFCIFFKEYINMKYYILLVLVLVYIIHNRLKKKFRFPTFIVLRLIKFLPFFIMEYEINNSFILLILYFPYIVKEAKTYFNLSSFSSLLIIISIAYVIYIGKWLPSIFFFIYCFSSVIYKYAKNSLFNN